MPARRALHPRAPQFCAAQIIRQCSRQWSAHIVRRRQRTVKIGNVAHLLVGHGLGDRRHHRMRRRAGRISLESRDHVGRALSAQNRNGRRIGPIGGMARRAPISCCKSYEATAREVGQCRDAEHETVLAKHRAFRVQLRRACDLMRDRFDLAKIGDHRRKIRFAHAAGRVGDILGHVAAHRRAVRAHAKSQHAHEIGVTPCGET